MQLTIELDDTLVTDALAAWARINDRRAADQRQPLSIDAAWLHSVAIQSLGNVLVADTHETENEATNAATQAVQQRIAELVQAVTPAEPDPVAPAAPK